ncbi:MAG: autolysin/adhesin Aae [Candidatus Saccharimonadales bacterium]
MSRDARIVSKNSALGNPLDQVSSADIAVTAARMTGLAETPSVTNHADSFDSQLDITQAESTVVAKPQVVATSLKSRKDIKTYVVLPGDTVTSIASKFGITSNSVRWSNSITTDTVAEGKKLVIPPVNGLIYTVKASDNVDTIAQKFSASKEQVVAFNDAEVAGITTNEQIVVPDGILPAPVATYASYSATASVVSSFAFGGDSAVYGFNGYDFGWCTWYAANRRAEIGKPVPSNLGDAYSWYRLAQRAGIPVGFRPAVGAVMVNESGNHVAVVEQVNGDGSFWISEMNSHGQISINDATPTGGWHVRDYKLISTVGNLKFIY